MKTLSLHTFFVRLIWLSVLPLVVLVVYLAIDHIKTVKAKLDRVAGDLAHTAAIIIDRHLEAYINALQILAASCSADNRISLKDFYAVETRQFQQGIDEVVLLTGWSMALPDGKGKVTAHRGPYERRYRQAYDIGVALNGIQGNRGILYDSVAVDACVKLIHEKGFSLG